jgi:hypothetical protein
MLVETALGPLGFGRSLDKTQLQEKKVSAFFSSCSPAFSLVAQKVRANGC